MPNHSTPNHFRKPELSNLHNLSFNATDQAINDSGVFDSDVADEGSDDGVFLGVVDEGVLVDGRDGWVEHWVDCLACDGSRHVQVVDSKTVPSNGMSGVIDELTKFFEVRAEVGVSAGAGGVVFQVEPESVVVRPGNCVSSEDVVGVGDPNSSWGLVSVEQAP